MLEGMLRAAGVCALAVMSLSPTLADVQEKTGTFNGLTMR